MFGSGNTTLTISKEQIYDIMKIIKSLEESCLVIKDLGETIKMKQKNKQKDFSECYLAL